MTETRAPMIVVQDLNYTAGERHILKNVNLTVYAGETLAVMGASGSGKTTLLKVIGGLLSPTSGKVFIGETDISRLSEERMNRVRLIMGFVFQYAALFDSMSVAENLAFGVRRHYRYTNQRIEDLVAEKLKVVGMDGTQDLMPEELSGGMQKRVGLARALTMDPLILLYDEPTSGLDPVTTTSIDELMMHLRDSYGVTSVMVSHHIPSIFRVADRIAMIYQGEILAVGTPDEIRQSDNDVVQQFIHGSTQGPISGLG
ncbi:MAG TPA: ABC transporter ATP-binding protein [Armatimonadota bacterium]|nr:ABC transporter ATP-binding protein [Armatimonadota bacterium]